MRRRVRATLAAILLISAGLACRAIGQPTPAPLPTAEPTVTVLPPTATPTETPPTATPLPQTDTPAPTVTPLPPTDTPPLPTPTATSQAVIHYFRANVEVADPGDTISLEWRWSGGTEATIYHLFGGQLSTPWWEVGPSGRQEYTISPQARNYDRFVLFVNDEQGVAAQETVEIELRCPDEWFFEPAPDVCPDDAAIVADGAEQHFERGVMLWNRAEDRIYVLFDDEGYPRWQAYEDKFEEGDPELDPDIEPPAGLYQPIRGFGLVWRERPGVRERLGWAVDTEAGYQTAIQRTSYVKYNHTYIQALDGGVWRLGPEQSEWEHIP